MDVSAANPGDVAALLAMRDDLARWLLDRGIEQWQPGELPDGWIERQVSQGWVHVVREEHNLVATVTVVPEDPIVWGHRPEPAGYVHQLMVDRRWGGKGLGAALLVWAETHITETGRALARLDCLRSNLRLRAYYETAGYRLVGYKDFPNVAWARETTLYEKALG